MEGYSARIDRCEPKKCPVSRSLDFQNPNILHVILKVLKFISFVASLYVGQNVETVSLKLDIMEEVDS